MENQNPNHRNPNEYIVSLLGKLDLVSTILFSLKESVEEDNKPLSRVLYHCSDVADQAKRDLDGYIDQLLNPGDYE